MRWLFAFVVIVALPGCACRNEYASAIDVYTDFLAFEEFDTVLVEIDGELEGRFRPPGPPRDVARPIRVGVINLPSGRPSVRVALVRGGTIVRALTWSPRITGPEVLRAWLLRSCDAERSCPASEGEAVRCDEACDPSDPPPVLCASAADCDGLSRPACADAACVASACFQVERPGACAATERCAETGCVPMVEPPPEDAGVGVDAPTTGGCTLPDGACASGCERVSGTCQPECTVVGTGCSLGCVPGPAGGCEHACTTCGGACMMAGASCLPSCAAAGGTCAGPVTCAGRPVLTAWDCSSACCAPDPVTEPVGDVSFHYVYEGEETHWDAISELGARYPAVMFVSPSRPDEITRERWVQNIRFDARGTAADTALFIRDLLRAPTGPRMVMVEGLTTATVLVMSDLAAATQRYPELEGRWGVFMGIPDAFAEPPVAAAIDAVMQRHAHIAVRMYFSRDDYCDPMRTTEAERDAWLSRLFAGDGTIARMNWLFERLAVNESRSHLSVMFGVTDEYMTGTNPGFFLDRMFYVWSRSRHAELLDPRRGSIGAFRWTSDRDGSIGVGPTSRDALFRDLVDHYALMRTPYFTEPVCP